MHIADMPEFKNRTRILTCQADENVYDAVVSMTYRRCGAIVITDKDGKLEGIFTERDLLARVVSNGYDIEKTKIGDVMSKNIETGNPKDSVLMSMGRMSHGRFRHLPIIDDKGNLLGMLSQGDFTSYIIRSMLEKQSA